jgi:hypothetical protein
VSPLADVDGNGQLDKNEFIMVLNTIKGLKGLPDTVMAVENSSPDLRLEVVNNMFGRDGRKKIPILQFTKWIRSVQVWWM